MKAKRILSLLLTVAMIATCATAFAAAPVTGYVQTQAVGNGLDNATKVAQGIHAEAVLPELDAPRIDFTVEKKTDDEIKAEFGSVTIPPPMAGKGYVVTATFADLGTLYSDHNTDWGMWFGGFGVQNAGFTLTSSSSYYNIANNSGTVAAAISKSGTTMTWQAENNKPTVNGSLAYPIANGEDVKAVDASFTYRAPVFGVEGTEFTVGNAYVALTNIRYNESSWSLETASPDGTPYDALQVSMWHPATITLAESTPDPDPVAPAFGANTAGDKNGVAIEGTNDRYDNAYAVDVTVTPNDAEEVGVLFIPEAVATTDTEWTTAAKATFEGLGKGETTVKAAIINIPRALEGIAFKMLAKAYAVLEGVTTYGAVSEQTILFEDSGINN